MKLYGLNHFFFGGGSKKHISESQKSGHHCWLLLLMGAKLILKGSNVVTLGAVLSLAQGMMVTQTQINPAGFLMLSNTMKECKTSFFREAESATSPHMQCRQIRLGLD